MRSQLPLDAKAATETTSKYKNEVAIFNLRISFEFQILANDSNVPETFHFILPPSFFSSLLFSFLARENFFTEAVYDFLDNVLAFFLVNVLAFFYFKG